MLRHSCRNRPNEYNYWELVLIILKLKHIPIHSLPFIIHPASPSPPRSVAVANSGDTWIEIAWQPPGFLGIPELSAYNILLFEHLTSQTENYTIDGLSHTFHGLLTGRIYTVIAAGVTQLATRTSVSEHSRRLLIATTTNRTTAAATQQSTGNLVDNYSSCASLWFSLGVFHIT